MSIRRSASRRRVYSVAVPLVFTAGAVAAGCSSSGGADEATSSSAQDLIVNCAAPLHPVCTPIDEVQPEKVPDILLPHPIPTPGPICQCVNFGTATFTPVREYALQPGWARATFNYALSGTTTATFSGSVTCATGNPSSVTVTATELSSSLVAVDVRANTGWLAANGLPTPCEVSSVTVNATNSWPIGSGTLTNTFATDVPLGFLTPAQLTAPITGASVSLQPAAATRRYVAFPPLILGIHSADGRTAFAEVEELTDRGTVGLRGMAAFVGNGLERELGGGAEIYPGWGLDVDLLGVTKVTSGTEESNPGHNEYTSPASGIPSLYFGDIGGPVYPAPPLYSEATYLADVLDNHSVPRCTDPNGCLDVVYNQATHTLNAINGATVEWIEGAPIQAATTTTLGTQAVILSATTAATTTAAVASAGLGLTASRAPMAVTTLLPPKLKVASPQQLIAAAPSLTPLSGTVQAGAAGTCPLNGTTSSVPLTQCNGYSAAFPCPTTGDPLRVDTLPFPTSPATVPNQLSLTAMMPQYAHRSNVFGTCGSHAATQYYELLVNKLAADMGTARTVTVDGQAIQVPNALVAYSVGGGLADLYNWGGTKAGDPSIDPSAAWPSGTGNHNLPEWINGYWPAYEADWGSWTGASVPSATAASELSLCASKGYWYSGYCVGEGQPPPGAYWSYNQQLATMDKSPFGELPWTIANAYYDVAGTNLSLSDRDAAIQQVIGLISNGLPVSMSLDAFSNNVTDSAGNQESLLGSMSWFLPPELAACTPAQISTAFQPNGGHEVNIIGYSIVGAPTAPDLFQSYFVIENNWGKDYGYGGYYTMNFAAFKFLASGLTTYSLNCPYNSLVCASASQICIPDPDGSSCTAGANCGSVENNCGQTFVCGGTCATGDTCSSNHCCPTGEVWNGSACSKPIVLPPCKTPEACCIRSGGDWSGSVCF